MVNIKRVQRCITALALQLPGEVHKDVKAIFDELLEDYVKHVEVVRLFKRMKHPETSGGFTRNASINNNIDEILSALENKEGVK